MVGVVAECELCKSSMEVIETKKIGATTYLMFICKKCNRTVAKRAET